MLALVRVLDNAEPGDVDRDAAYESFVQQLGSGSTLQAPFALAVVVAFIATTVVAMVQRDRRSFYATVVVL